MENMNNQGKTQKQHEDSARFAYYGIVGIVFLLVLASLVSCKMSPH